MIGTVWEIINIGYRVFFKPIIESMAIAITRDSTIAIIKPVNASYKVINISYCIEVKSVIRLSIILLGEGSMNGGKISNLEMLSHINRSTIKKMIG